jgi:hypothetical protein
MLRNECISVLDKILCINYEGQYCLWERLKILLWERKPPQIYCAKKIRTMEKVTFSSRCPHGTLMVRSRQGHGAFTICSRYAHDGQTKHSSRVLKRIWSWPYRACEMIAKVDNLSDTKRRTSDLLLTATWPSIWCKLCVTYLQGNYVYGRRSLIKFYHIFILSHPIVLQSSRGYELKYNTTVRHNCI